MKFQKLLIVVGSMIMVISLLFFSCKDEEDDTDNTFNVTASFTITPETGSTNTVFTFDASGTVMHGEIETIDYEWYFGDGNEIIGGGVTETHQYETPGDYDAELVVKVYKPSNTGSAGDSEIKTLTVSLPEK